MAEIITMLALSPTMEEGTIAEWSKAEGEEVEEGEIIAEVETDKATMEMESFFEGTILKVLVKAGDTVKVGDPMAVIGEPGEDADAALAELGGHAGSASSVKSKKDQQSKKEDASQSAEQKPSGEEQSDSQSGGGGDKASRQAQPSGENQRSEEGQNGERVKSSPLARKMAKAHQIELSSLRGSGPGGRIIKQDIEEAIASNKAPASSGEPSAAPVAAPSLSGELRVIGEMPDASVSYEPQSQMRKAIARRMTQVWQNTPFFYLTTEIDMAAAMAERKRLNAELKAAEIEIKISVNDMIVRASALALRAYPRMNCAFAGDQTAFFDEVHIGVAVALEDGLITPTLRHADQKTLSQIATETRELAGRARDKKLKPGEFGGSTFSISNLGMYGIDHFQAVINPPESGILACGAVRKVPVVNDDGELSVGTSMKITLTCDHRAVDGAIGAEFLQHLKRRLENPVLLMV